MKSRRSFLARVLAIAILLPPFYAVEVSAHGGEDHGESKPATVTNAAGAVTRTARAGDLEVTLKHQPLEPDTETGGKLFVTKFETNEPSDNSTPVVEVVTGDNKVYEASEIKAGEPGAFNFKLPPLPAGSYTIRTRLSSGGKSETATFADVAIEAAHAESPADVASWARTALFVLGGTVVFGLLGAFSYFALRSAQRSGSSSGETRETIGKEAISV